MKAFMFPGQGSQVRGMGGAQLFDEDPDLVAQADAILGYSVRELCLEDPRGELNRTQFTQPALFVINALSYRRRARLDGDAPDYLAGHSLGEFNALLAAGCFDFEVGLRLVQKRGELMSRAASGAMAAILNGTRDEIEAVLQEHALSTIDVANYNAPKQIVISGDRDEIGRAQTCFPDKMTYYPLNTSGAFHSRLMRPAQAEFEAFLGEFSFADPQIPVISNVTARPYAASAVKDNLAQQIASTVRWSESIQYLMSLARERGAEIQFEELGNGDVLTKLLRSIRQQTPDLSASPTPPEPRSKPVTAAAEPRPGASSKVGEWNRRHPVGSKVRSTAAGYGELETRSEAVVLFGHRAAVYMKGYGGYFDLDELTPA